MFNYLLTSFVKKKSFLRYLICACRVTKVTARIISIDEIISAQSIFFVGLLCVYHKRRQDYNGERYQRVWIHDIYRSIKNVNFVIKWPCGRLIMKYLQDLFTMIHAACWRFCDLLTDSIQFENLSINTAGELRHRHSWRTFGQECSWRT